MSPHSMFKMTQAHFWLFDVVCRALHASHSGPWDTVNSTPGGGDHPHHEDGDCQSLAWWQAVSWAVVPRCVVHGSDKSTLGSLGVFGGSAWTKSRGFNEVSRVQQGLR